MNEQKCYCVLSLEVCESSVIMCPRCDKMCKVWRLSDTCTYAKVRGEVGEEGREGRGEEGRGVE